ncbi:activating signal cointegrator 1 complex subunit 2 isoform X2 [Ceratina calcarata]|nr:activating signal cointegrator 1 complex subunit 2 isoform X2 [Ceratina calcarata]
MTKNVSYANMEAYQNPNNLPLEDLKLSVRTDGVTESIDALSKYWASDYIFLHYETPQLYDEDGNEIMGAKEHWMEVVNNMIEDMKWLLCLPYYKFWSNVIFNNSILNALVSFLQDAPPFYTIENFSNYPDMLELLETLSHYVLVVFTRLITNKESKIEYMSNAYFGTLLYENYVFTIPIIFDLCQLYGRENEKVVRHILRDLFTLEPRYNDDLKRAVPCLIEAYENVEQKFNNDPTHCTNEAVSLSNRPNNANELTLFKLEDMILYVLDISSTINAFLKNHVLAINIFHREEFMNKLVKVYESTIPEMYRALCQLAYNDENMPKYMELKHRLNVTRIEILSLFRAIIYEPILNLQANLTTIEETAIKKEIDDYLNLLSNAISEKEFITDYDQFYPVKTDLNTISNLCPEIDTIKRDYILQSLDTIGKCSDNRLSIISNNINEAGPSGVLSRTTIPKADTKPTKKQNEDKSVEIACLVSAVKDIFYDLDEHFIKLCLDHYKNDTEAVINAALEDNLPLELKKIRDSQNVPQEIFVNEDLARGFETLNVNDNYNYENDVHVKTEKIIEIPKDYITKNYSLIADVYDDEYDDTYDDRDTNAQDDSIEVDSRPFTTPRVFWKKQKVETAENSDSEDEEIKGEANGKDQFVQNPEEVRAKAEQRRQAMRGNKPNVIGAPKGRGQEKDVLYNRQQKNTQKSKRANHNRRTGAQWKRNQGMVPS